MRSTSIMVLLAVCVLFAQVSGAGDAPADNRHRPSERSMSRLVLRPVPDTGLPEMLKRRRELLERRTGAPLKGHQWWLWGLGAFDYDSDGDLDLIVCIHGATNGLIIKNLWKETGRITFVDATEQLGVDGFVPSTDNYPLVWDFDGDGDLDIAGLLDDTRTPCLLNQDGRSFRKASFSLHPINYPSGLKDLDDDGYVDIYQNPRRMTGTRIAMIYDPKDQSFKKEETRYESSVALPASVRTELTSLAENKNNRYLRVKLFADHDLNGDGRRDVVVRAFGSYSGDRMGWYLLAGQDGELRDQTEALGLPRKGAPLLIADVDYDSDADLLLASGPEAGLFLNDGRGRFEHKPGPLTDFIKQRCPYLHVAFRADLDNDGDLDLAISNRRYGRQQIFENSSHGEFLLALRCRGWDADPLVINDINDDGRMDVIVGGCSEKESICVYLNETPNVGNFCKLYPRMDAPNTYAVGARVEVFPAGRLGRKDVQPLLTENGHADGTPIHVGLGTRRRIDVRVSFPGHAHVELKDIEASGRLTVRPNQSATSR